MSVLTMLVMHILKISRSIIPLQWFHLCSLWEAFSDLTYIALIQSYVVIIILFSDSIIIFNFAIISILLWLSYVGRGFLYCNIVIFFPPKRCSMKLALELEWSGFKSWLWHLTSCYHHEQISISWPTFSHLTNEINSTSYLSTWLLCRWCMGRGRCTAWLAVSE